MERLFAVFKIMEVRIYGDAFLKKKASPIKEITKEVKEIASDMISTMRKKEGIGLAATQVGIAKRIIAVEFTPNGENVSNPLTPGELFFIPQMPLVLVNPEMSEVGDEKISIEEGCLSVPGVYSNVVRHKKIMLSAKLIGGENIRLECGGLLAIILQHEIDHLNGVLFIDRLEEYQIKKIEKKLASLKKENKK